MSQSQAMQSEIEQIPGTNYYDTGRTMQQSQQVKGLLGNATEQNEQRLKLQEQIENDGTAAVANPEDTEASVQRANELIQKTQKAQLESTFGKTPDTPTRKRGNDKGLSFEALRRRLLFSLRSCFFGELLFSRSLCGGRLYSVIYSDSQPSGWVLL